MLIFQSNGTINGQISFADGTPVPSVIVTATPIPASDIQRARSTRTNESGGYRLNVPAGRYYIRATISLTSFVYHPGATTEAGATAVSVSAGSTVDAGAFAFPLSLSGVNVRGRVRFPLNHPARAGNKGVTLTGMGVQSRPIVDDAFEFTHVLPGIYTVNMDVPGLQPVRLTVNNEEIRAVELIVPPLITVSGKFSLSNILAPQFSVAFEGETYRTRTPITAGFFSVQLPPGDYRILTPDLPADRYLAAMTSGTTNLLTTQLRVKAPESPAPILITVGASSGVKAAGQIRTSGDRLLAGFPRKLSLTAAGTNAVVECSVSDDGAFELPKVMPGTYFARVTLTPAVSSPPVPLVIPDKGSDELDIAISGPKEISGRVVVDGFGPPPKFSFLLVRGSDFGLNSAKSSELPTLSTNATGTALTSLVRNANPGNQVLRVNVNALPDGSFKLMLPEGEYRLAATSDTSAIASSYVLKSLDYGSQDLLKEALKISGTDTAELNVGYGTTIQNPWFKISGKVSGSDPIKGPYRIALESSLTSTIESALNPDGTFEFPRVLRQNTYTVRLLPINPATSTPRVAVVDKDVEGVEIIVPAEREITGSVVVDGNAAIPGFMLSLLGSSSSVTTVVKPDANGTFTIKLPMDERRVRLSGLPMGYELKSLTYGATDLLKQPLKIQDTAQLRVTVSTDPRLPSGSLRGRVIGLDPDRGSVRLALNGVTSFSVFETAVSSNGSFSFSDLPQGAYALSLMEDATSIQLTPSSVAITESEILNFEVQATKSGAKPNRSQTEEAPTGASVVDLGGGNREVTNENAAIVAIRTINTAQITHLAMNGGRYGSISDLIAAGLLDSRFKGTVSGFHFSIIAAGKKFEVAAVPTSFESGRYAFFSTPDGVVRYAAMGFLSPKGQNGSPVQ